MKFKLISAYLVMFLLALSVQGGRTVNSRKITIANDFLSEGAGPRYANQESLNVELANILSTTKDRDAIDVDMVIGDSISTVTSIVSGAGGVDIDTIINLDSLGAGIVNLDTLEYADNGNGHPEQGILKTSVVTIGHVGATNTDFAFVTAANTTEQTLATDTIPAYARILDVMIITTEAVVGITTSFTVDIGDAAGDAEFATATDIKALNAMIGCVAAGAIVLAPITSATTIFVNGTPANENWSLMTAGEFTLITTYLDYGALRTKF